MTPEKVASSDTNRAERTMAHTLSRLSDCGRAVWTVTHNALRNDKTRSDETRRDNDWRARPKRCCCSARNVFQLVSRAAGGCPVYVLPSPEVGAVALQLKLPSH